MGLQDSCEQNTSLFCLERRGSKHLAKYDFAFDLDVDTNNVGYPLDQADCEKAR